MTSGEYIQTEAELRALYKQPSAGSVAKELGRIDPHMSAFIALSPFFCIGTTGPDDKADVSPRGGAPGFVHVLDEGRLAIPDRPGNNRLDTLGNLVRQPAVALAFFVPGFEDVVRVNGTARISTDPALIERFTLDGDKAPRSVLVVEVREAMLHCAKAIRRAGLWDPAAQVERSAWPTAGQVLRDHLALDVEVAQIDERLEKSNRETLY